MRSERRNSCAAANRSSAATAGTEQSRVRTRAEGERRFLTSPIASICLTGALFALILSTQSYFDKLFADFGLERPAVTVLISSPFLLWLTGLAFGLTIFSQGVLAGRSERAVYSAAAVVAAVLLGILYFVGMSVPLIRLIVLLST